MFTKPKHGWTYLNIGEIKPRASYLTNIPEDILDALINFYKTRTPQSIFFDAEGYEWYLILGYGNCYILIEKESLVCEVICESVDKFTDMFIENLTEYEKEWDEWDLSFYKGYKNKLEELKKLIKWEE